jgi:hypothetical protein
MKVQAVLLAAARVSSAATGGLAEITKTLPGGQIRAQFAGMKLTDEVHHRLVYERDGTLDSGRIFVNLPGARSVAVIDRSSEKQVTTWPMEQGGNYAMTLDRARPDSPGVSQLVEACGFRDDGRQAGLDDRDLRRRRRSLR